MSAERQWHCIISKELFVFIPFWYWLRGSLQVIIAAKESVSTGILLSPQPFPFTALWVISVVFGKSGVLIFSYFLFYWQYICWLVDEDPVVSYFDYYSLFTAITRNTNYHFWHKVFKPTEKMQVNLKGPNLSISSITCEPVCNISDVCLDTFLVTLWARERLLEPTFEN